MGQPADEFTAGLCPGLVDNTYIPEEHFPHPAQEDFLAQSLRGALTLDPNDVFEGLFGGAVGGGKSDAALMAAAQMVHLYPGSATAILRRTHQELVKPGALLNRALQWWSGLPGVNWNGSDSLFTFPNGSQVQFGYHHHPKHDAQYQGGEYQLVVFDELTYFPDDAAWLHLRSRMRRPEGSGWPLRLLATSNPGGPGHNWVKNRFVGGKDPITGETIHPAFPYFPSRLTDNPSLDVKAYTLTLQHLRPARREQLLNGDWDAKEPGQYFQAEWFGPLLDPEKDKWPAGSCTRVRSWDLAASTEESASETAGVLMARHIRGVRAVEHCISFRKSPGERDAKIIQVAKQDGPTVIQHIEVEPGSGGISQVLNLEVELKKVGCRVTYARPKVDQTKREAERVSANPDHAKGKTGRADPVSSCLYRGYVQRGECPDTGDSWWGMDSGRAHGDQREGIRLFAGPWTQSYLDDMEAFPLTLEGNSTKIIRADKTDATTGAWVYLESHSGEGSRWVSDLTAAYDREMEEDDEGGESMADQRDLSGHWKD